MSNPGLEIATSAFHDRLRRAFHAGCRARVVMVQVLDQREARWRAACGRIDLLRPGDLPRSPVTTGATVVCLEEWLDEDSFFSRLLQANAGGSFRVLSTDVVGHGMDGHWSHDDYQHKYQYERVGVAWPCHFSLAREIDFYPRLVPPIEVGGERRHFASFEQLARSACGYPEPDDRGNRGVDVRIRRVQLAIWDYRARISRAEITGRDLTVDFEPSHGRRLKIFAIADEREVLDAVGPSPQRLAFAAPPVSVDVQIREADEPVARALATFNRTDSASEQPASAASSGAGVVAAERDAARVVPAAPGPRVLPALAGIALTTAEHVVLDLLVSYKVNYAAATPLEFVRLKTPKTVSADPDATLAQLFDKGVASRSAGPSKARLTAAGVLLSSRGERCAQLAEGILGFLQSRIGELELQFASYAWSDLKSRGVVAGDDEHGLAAATIDVFDLCAGHDVHAGSPLPQKWNSPQDKSVVRDIVGIEDLYQRSLRSESPEVLEALGVRVSVARTIETADAPEAPGSTQPTSAERAADVSADAEQEAARTEQRHVIPSWLLKATFGLGAVLVILTLVLVTLMREPTALASGIFRTALALGVASAGVGLTGSIGIKMRLKTHGAVTATGSLALFAAVYFWNPTGSAMSSPPPVGPSGSSHDGSGHDGAVCQSAAACAEGFLCVDAGNGAARCRRSCTQAGECGNGLTCKMLYGRTIMACGEQPGHLMP